MYHFVGIGGVGMSALARILIEKGETVSGSDSKESSACSLLRELQATVHIGHKAENRPEEATIIYSSAVEKTNPEMGANALHRSDLLAQLLTEKKGLLVAGTHGKTSTAGLLSWTLSYGGLDPSFAIGGYLQGKEENGHHGKGDYFVAEADESDGTLNKYSGDSAIVLNADADHLDHYNTQEKVRATYSSFLDKPFKHLYICGDDPFLATKKGTTFGFNAGNQVRATNYRQMGWTSYFDLEGGAENIALNVPGKQMATNALAVFALCRDLGMSEKTIRAAFATFPGMKRRYEFKGERGGALYYDDYAHHPLEVEAMLVGLKSAYPRRRLVAIFQPHRYTRLQAFMDDFSKAFFHANQVIITDVYSAGEAPIENVDGKSLAEKIRGATYIPQKDLKLEGKSGDVVVTIGAGDITKIHES